VEIRFKDGMPLMVGGQVAGSQTCCCENPPPPFCWQCGDLCSYVMSVTEPAALQTSGRLGCGSGEQRYGSTRTTFMFDSILPSGFSDYPGVADGSFYGGNWNGSRGEAWIDPWPFGPRAFVEHGRYGTVTDPPYEPCDGPRPSSPDFRLVASVSASITCDPERTPTPHKVVIVAAVSCGLPASTDEKGISCGGSWFWNAWAEFDLSSSCITAPSRSCGGYPGQVRHFDTPATFVADGTTTSLGAYMATSTGSDGPMAAWCQSYGEALRDELSATFRITSRENCLPPKDCSCSYNLAGLLLQFQGEVFTVGNEPNDIRGAGGVRYVYTDSLTSPNITFERFNESFTETYFLASATISCSPSADPETVADKWLLTVSATCFTWEDDGNGGREIVEQTTKTWVGEYECFENCGRFTPGGAPILMLLVSTVTTPGLGACDPGTSPPIISVVGYAPCE
jgi:hypothetical protein